MLMLRYALSRAELRERCRYLTASADCATVEL